MFELGHYKQFCTNPDGSTASFEFEFSDGSLCIVSILIVIQSENQHILFQNGTLNIMWE